jgi:hypothetical protein
MLMLFAAILEVLIAIFARPIDDRIVQNIAGSSPLERTSIYVDDMVIFFKPNVHKLTRLWVFCICSQKRPT